MENETFLLSILAPERRLLESQPVLSLIATTSQGEIQVLPGHANLVAQLETGRFEYRLKGGEKVSGVISSGFLNIENGSVNVMAETIELPEEIDLNRAKRAQEYAEKMLKDATLDPAAFRKYELKIQRAIIRQHVGGATQYFA